MPNLKLTNVESALQNAAREIVRQAKLNVGAEQTIRANDGSLRRTRIDTSGTLRNSLKAGEVQNKAEGLSVEIYMEGYGEFVDQGVSGLDYSTPEPSEFKFRTPGVGKAMQTSILNWMKMKNIRVRDTSGKYAKGGFDSYQFQGLAYIIARGIKRRGIAQTHFITTPFRMMEEKLPNLLREAFEKDLDNYLNNPE